MGRRLTIAAESTAVGLIRDPTGPKSPYDFQSVSNLIGFLNKDLARDNSPIVADLRSIVNDTLAGRRIKKIPVVRDAVDVLYGKIWDVMQQFDGHLTTSATIGLARYFEKVLGAKYYLQS